MADVSSSEYSAEYESRMAVVTRLTVQMALLRSLERDRQPREALQRRENIE